MKTVDERQGLGRGRGGGGRAWQGRERDPEGTAHLAIQRLYGGEDVGLKEVAEVALLGRRLDGERSGHVPTPPARGASLDRAGRRDVLIHTYTRREHGIQ